MPIRKTSSRAKFKHERIKSPKAFDPRSFRTKRAGASRIIVGCPRGKYSSSAGRCKVGMRAQSILRPKRNPTVISREKYKSLKKHGYVGKSSDGQLYMLTMDKKTGGTILEPIEVEKKVRSTIRGKRNPCGTRNKPSTSTLSWQTWADKQERQMRKDIDHFIEQGMNKKQVVELVLGGSTIGKPYKDRIRKDYGVNPKKKTILDEAILYSAKLHKKGTSWNDVFHALYKKYYGRLTFAEMKKAQLEGVHKGLPVLEKGKMVYPKGWKSLNPRKQWYYGPSVTHRGKVLVFPSSKTPTQGTHGRRVKYAVGPFKTSEEAAKKAKYMEMSATGR